MIDPWKACQLPDDLSFEDWVKHVFDHPILSPEWYFQTQDSAHYQSWNSDARPDLALEHMTRLFTSPAFLVDAYTPAQIDQGLGYLVSNSCSNHMFVLRNDGIPWARRRACFDAMVPLYAELMARVYGDLLGHTLTVNDENINYACYMWWDIIPLYGKMDPPKTDPLDEAVFHIFESVLQLKSEACLESVLHGIGHWHWQYPERTAMLVAEFLKRTDISDTLREYAEAAATGCVP